MSLQELINNAGQLAKFKEMSTPEAQFLVLERFDPRLKSASSDARNIVLNKLISTPVQVGEGTDVPLSWKEVPLEALKNIPSSSLNFVKDIWATVKDPVGAELAIEDIVVGGFQKLIPGEQKNEQKFNAIVDFFKNRFGGIENVKNTIANDPVGLASDVAAIFTGVGTGLKQIPKLAKVGQVASKIGGIVDPVGGTGKAVSFASKEGVPRLARSFTKTALKPTAVGKRLSEIQKLEKVDQLASEFIQRGLKINRKSIIRLGDNIKDVQKKIGGIIEKGDRTKVRISVNEIVKPLDDLITELDNLPIKTSDNLRDMKILTKFKDEVLKSGKTLTPSQVQRVKVLKNKSYEVGLKTVVDSVKKVANDSLRAASKQVLENNFPQLKALNKNQGVMIELQKAIAKRIQSLESQKTIGVTGLVAGGGGAAAAGIVSGAAGLSVAETFGSALAFGAAAIITERIITSPKIQILIAKAINEANKTLARAGKLRPIAQPSFQAGRVFGEIEGKAQEQQSLDSQRLQSVNN